MGNKIVKCPNCGEELQLNENFTKGFCLYCGSPIVADAQEEQNEPDENLYEERLHAFEKLKSEGNYVEMLSESSTVLQNDRNNAVANAYAGLALAHGADSMNQMTSECFVGQLSTPNPMNIAMPDFNNCYFKLQSKVSEHFAKALSSGDVNAVNVVFDVIDEIAQDFDDTSATGIYLANGISDCQNTLALKVTRRTDFIANNIVWFLQTIFENRPENDDCDAIAEQRIWQICEEFEQVIADKKNKALVPTVMAVVAGLKYDCFDIAPKKSVAPNRPVPVTPAVAPVVAPVITPAKVNTPSISDALAAATAAIHGEQPPQIDSDDTEREYAISIDTAAVMRDFGPDRARNDEFFGDDGDDQSFAASSDIHHIDEDSVAPTNVGHNPKEDKKNAKKAKAAEKAKKEKKLNFFRDWGNDIKQLPTVYISLLVMALGFMMLVCSLNLPLLCIIVPIVWIIILSVQISFYKRSVCKKCKSYLDGGDYGYHEVSRREKHTDKFDTYYITYEFERECPQCGEINRFKKEFSVAQADKEKGTYQEFDINLDEYATPTRIYKPKEKKIFFVVGIILSVIGLAMIIGGSILLAKNGGSSVLNQKGDDPKDYYGTYEYVDNETYGSLTLDNDGRCLYRNGSNAGIGSDYAYEYVSSKWACKNYPDYRNSSYSEYDAIVVYIYGKDDPSTVLLFAVKPENNLFEKEYTLIYPGKGYRLTKIAGDGRKNSVDPKNYYYTYTYNSRNIIRFYESTAAYTLNGSTTYYNYEYVQKEYIKRYIPSLRNSSYDVLLLKVSSTQYIVFYVVGEYTLKTTDNMMYTRSTT